MAASVGIFFVDGSGEHLDGTHEQLAVFVSGAFQVFDEMLEFVGHGVESVCQFADFGAAPEINALREVAASEGAAGFGQHVQGIGDAARGKNADQDAQQHCDQGKQARGALHLKDAAIGFTARLLHDHCPVQRRHGTDRCRAWRRDLSHCPR